jgi:crossover junction endodeoxyribonuclease RusA
MRVALPWPPSILSPNARVHWAKKSKVAKAYKTACWALTKEAKLVAPAEGPIDLDIEFVPPDRRGRDLDNMLASIKHGLDGVALALSVDDRRFRLRLSVSEGIGGMVKVAIDTATDKARP